MPRRPISFVYSNPRHHAEMMAPVMAELVGRGVPCRAVSMAELRGFATGPLGVDGVELHRAVPARLRKNPSMGASFGTGESRARSVRRAAQLAVWAGWLAPRLAWLTRGSDAIVVPNDAAFPYRELTRLARLTRTPLVLMQEGIRFPLPGVSDADAYGRAGAAVVCAWGEASAEYFRAQGAPPASIHVTGNPRFDRFDPAAWREQGRALLAELGIARPPLVYLSNPIDDQGFCTTRDKMELFRGFADGVADQLDAGDRHLLVKLHPREDVDAFRRAAADSRAAARTRVLADDALFAVLAGAGAAVVLASTVGLEALLFGRPLGVLEVPGAGFVFDYVQGGGARGLRLDAELGGAVGELLAAGDAPTTGVTSLYLERHLAHRGSAAPRIAGLVEGLGTGADRSTAARAASGRPGGRERSES
ncbi:MAG TPA: hypothetical protein VK698_19735 [Kofleriaceae bacterium]|nr:hypothetical protein [Kofleriaceae bacterium]